MFDYRRGNIWIDRSLCPQQMADALLHEILHAIHNSLAFHCHKRPSDERIASQYAGALIEVMRDNPKLLRWIRKVTR
jgi:hypothetical protein